MYDITILSVVNHNIHFARRKLYGWLTAKILYGDVTRKRLMKCPTIVTILSAHILTHIFVLAIVEVTLKDLVSSSMRND